jgi:hypothetical protein
LMKRPMPSLSFSWWRGQCLHYLFLDKEANAFIIFFLWRGQCLHCLFLDEEANAFIIFFLMKRPMPSLSFSW